MTAPCWIYKSSRKDELYLYVSDENDFSRVPPALIEQFGTPQFVMKLTLDASRRLARADPSDVLAHLRSHGWYLQMPPSPGADARQGA